MTYLWGIAALNRSQVKALLADLLVLRILVVAEVGHSRPLGADVQIRRLEGVAVVHRAPELEADRSLVLVEGKVNVPVEEVPHMERHSLGQEEVRSLVAAAGRSPAVDIAVDSLVVDSLLVVVEGMLKAGQQVLLVARSNFTCAMTLRTQSCTYVAVVHSHTGLAEARHRVEGNMT